MAEIASAFVSLLPSAKGFGSKLEGEVGGQVKSAGKKLGSGFGKAFAVAGGLVAAAGVGKFLKGAIADAEEARRLSAITANAIKVTGSAAKVTTKQVTDLAGAIARKTGIDDAQIQAGQNLILTFKNIANEGKGLDAIFDRTTKAAVDLSAAGFGSIEGASLQLGKALNDPLKGISALGRSGVTFTAEQKELIKSLVEQNDLLGAQKIILGEVEAQVGGAGAAAATATGKLSYAFGEFKESIGTALLPVVDRFANFLRKKIIPAMSAGAKAAGIVGRAFAYLFNGGEEGARGFAEIIDSAFGNTGRFITPVQKLTEAVQTFLGAAARVREEVAARLQPVFDKFGDFIRENPEFVKAFAVALGVLVGAIGLVTLATTAFSIALNTTGIPLVIIAIAALVAGLVVAYQKSEQFRSIVDQVAAVMRDNVLPILKSVGQFIIGTVVPAVVELAKAVGTALKPVFDAIVETFQTAVLPTLQKVLAKIKENGPAIRTVVTFIGQWIGFLIKLAATVLGKVLPPIIRFAGFMIEHVVPAVVDVILVIVRIIAKIIDFGRNVVAAVKKVGEFVKGLKEKFENAKTYVEGIPEKIKTALGDLGQLLYEKGKALIEGLIGGIKKGVAGAVSYVKTIPSQLTNAFKGSGGTGGVLAGAETLSHLLHNQGPAATGSTAGHRVVAGFVKAVTNKTKGLPAAGFEAVEKLGDSLADSLKKQKPKVENGAKKLVDALRSQLQSLRSEMQSLASSIADAFRPDLFAGNLSDLFSVGSTSQSSLKQLVKAFKKLRGMGLGPGFLSQLFASGNTGLILQLASSDKATAQSAQQLFNQTNSLANSLGGAVSKNEFGPTIDRLADRLEKAIDRLGKKLDDAPKKHGREVGRVINGAAVRGLREAAA